MGTINEDIAEFGELDALNEAANAEREAYSLRVRAQNFSSEAALLDTTASNQIAAGRMAMMSIAISGVGTVSGKNGLAIKRKEFSMRVPHVDFGGITKVSGVSSPYQTAKGATPEAFGAGPARALIQGGQTLTKEANTLGKIALDIQQEDNESEVEKLDAEAMRRVRLKVTVGS